MSKQPLPTECFETAFLEYLRMRFKFEPLPHYVMAAMEVCHQTSRTYPEFMTAFFVWFTDSFLFETRGRFPAQGHNANPSDAQWRRYEDCQDLLESWLDDDLDAALDRQEARLVLVEDVEAKRTEDRSDESASGRRRARSKKPDTVVFAEIAEEKGLSPDTVRRTYQRYTKPEQYMSYLSPIALVRCEGGYTVETREVAKPGHIFLKPGKKLRL